jgi:hypothetical protein
MVGHNAAKKHEIEFTLSLLAQQVFPYISWLLIQEDAREYARVCVPHARRACLQLVRPVAGRPSAGEHFRTMLGFGSYILNIPIEGNSRDKSSFQRKREKKKKRKKKNHTLQRSVSCRSVHGSSSRSESSSRSDSS